DLFIMPNIPVKGDMEGFGIVLLEANMARTPAIASDLEGIRDVIEQGKNGYRVPPENPDRFSEKVNQVLENGFSRFSDSARSYVQERFNWERVSEQYLDYLQNVIKDQRTYNPKI
ncbi:MAG: glycosyltransferase family 4 protein, partial [Balneolaceae bacterium]|nr:glycosyltransferase family 4 protein [Balneolaceae bacterium]